MHDKAFTDIMNRTTLIQRTADKLSDNAAMGSVIVGFDGFVDKIIHLVDERTGPDTFKRMESMALFGDRISKAAGYSCNIEMIPQRIKLGGNGPIMANALAHLNHAVTYIGAIGKEEVHPVFKAFSAACDRVIPLADPAHTQALEFHDGKIMLGQMNTLRAVNWKNLIRHISEYELTEMLTRTRLVAAVNWTMLPFMNSILKGLTGLLERIENRLALFIDLADPQKRTDEDLAEVLHILSGMQHHADVILGMNENESIQVAHALNITTDDITKRAPSIREKLGTRITLIHPVSSACAADAEGVYFLEGPYTPEPKLTTGAGDIFNCGFCHGMLSELTSEESIATGVCSSGYYVRNGKPADRNELIEFMRSWASGKV